jgi:hypothetical protein
LSFDGISLWQDSEWLICIHPSIHFRGKRVTALGVLYNCEWYDPDIVAGMRNRNEITIIVAFALQSISMPSKSRPSSNLTDPSAH